MPKSTTETPRAEAIRVFREYDAELTLISELASNPTGAREQKSEAQRRLRDLKDRFKQDIRDYSRYDAGNADVYPLYLLRRVLAEASARIHVRWNSDPAKSRWNSDLYDARTDIRYYLHRLENPKEATDEASR